MNQSFINRIKQDRYFDHLKSKRENNKTLYQRLFIRSDHWRFGDLYGLSYLSKYKFNLEPFKSYPRKIGSKNFNRVLYIIGDSYLADKELDGAFKQFDHVIFLDDRFPFGPISLDSTKQNYLIMEFAERNLNDFNFKTTNEVKWKKRELTEGKNYNLVLKRPITYDFPTTIWGRLNKILFNKDLSRNLELLIFDDKFFTPLKEFKAAFNYKFLGTLPQGVAVSDDQSRLLMSATVFLTSRQSIYRKVSDLEITDLLNNLNQAHLYYRSIGFKDIFLSVIPNPVSLYNKHELSYNHLLERVEKNNSFPVISVFKKYRTYTSNLYYKSDTHWNPSGLDNWVIVANKKLSKIIQ